MGGISRLTILFAVAVLLQQELLGSSVLVDAFPLGYDCTSDNQCGDHEPAHICAEASCRCVDGYIADGQDCIACGGNLTGSTGTFTSPYYPDLYPLHGECSWHITVQSGFVICLSFPFFDIQGPAETCNFDYVSVYNNSTASANSLLGKFCGLVAPPTIASENNVMTVSFYTDYEVILNGFNASYDTYSVPSPLGGPCCHDNHCEDNEPTEVCRDNICECAAGLIQSGSECKDCSENLGGSIGTFASPNFPAMYPLNIDCRWHITVQSCSVISLSFSSFAIEPESTCDFDYVSVYDGPTVYANLLGKFCGNDVPPNIASTNNTMTVSFTSDSEIVDKGFNATYVASSSPLGGPCCQDNNCGDNEPSEICVNSTCVCAQGYIQSGSECTEDGSVPLEPTCNCTVQGDPRVRGFDSMGVFVSPVNNHVCIMADTQSCQTVNEHICLYTISVLFGSTGLPVGVKLSLYNVVDDNDYTFYLPDANNDNPAVGTYVTDDVVSGIHSLVIDDSTCQIRISIEPDKEVYISVQSPDENLESCHGGLCGNCNDVFDDYYLANGTSVMTIPQKFDLMRDSFCYLPDTSSFSSAISNSN